MATKPTAALAILRETNGNAYDASTNPRGLAQGGHRQNFEPALKAVADVGEYAADSTEETAQNAEAADQAAQTATQARDTTIQARDATLGYRNQAQTARDEAQSYAAGLNMPPVTQAAAGRFLKVNAAGTGYETTLLNFATQAQAEAGTANDVLMSPLGVARYVNKRRGAASGVASLGADGKVPKSEMVKGLYQVRQVSITSPASVIDLGAVQNGGIYRIYIEELQFAIGQNVGINLSISSNGGSSYPLSFVISSFGNFDTGNARLSSVIDLVSRELFVSAMAVSCYTTGSSSTPVSQASGGKGSVTAPMNRISLRNTGGNIIAGRITIIGVED